MYAGRYLSNAETPADYGIQREVTMDLLGRLVGAGAIHDNGHTDTAIAPPCRIEQGAGQVLEQPAVNQAGVGIFISFDPNRQVIVTRTKFGGPAER